VDHVNLKTSNQISHYFRNDYETIMITWLRKIIYEIGDENLALQALSQAQEEIKS
jgi:hypothetical protein